MKKYLKFIVAYHFIPTALTFHYLAEYINILVAYLIACTLWGSIIYKLKL